MQRPPTALYKCIIPAKKPITTSGAIYHSHFRESWEGAQTVPYPAWPEIEDANTQCCLPTLLEATYLVHRGVDVKPEDAVARIEEYLSRQENVEPEIREHARAIVKSQQSVWRQWAEVGTVPAITFGPHSIFEDIQRKLGRSAFKVIETYIQAFIYGYLDSFIDEEEAFGYAHEYAHRIAGGTFHSGSVLYELGERAHQTLYKLYAERLCSNEIANLWAHFWQTNEQIVHLVRRFRPIEEIFANYIGLRLSPPEVRKAVEESLEKALKEENWYTAYKAFVSLCDSSDRPLEVCSYICQLFCRMLENVDIDGAKLLDKYLKALKIFTPYFKIILQKHEFNKFGLENISEKLARLVEQAEADIPDEVLESVYKLLEQADIPDEVLESVYKTAADMAYPNNVRQEKAIINSEEQILELLPPVVSLRGRPSLNEIILFITYTDSQHEHESHDFAYAKIFFESLRQQLSMRCGIVCMHAIKGKPCCGAKEALLSLYERLPEPDRKRFQSPNCDLIR
jgi:hypothetical protein